MTAQAGASTGIVGKVVYQITESISLRASAKFGTMGVELELGGSRRISNFSTAGCSVVAGMQVANTCYAIASPIKNPLTRRCLQSPSGGM